jgi:hypothetical protein
METLTINAVADTHSSQTMWDGILQMHIRREYLIKTLAPAEFKKAWRAAKPGFEATLPRASATIGSMIVLASYTGEIWDLLSLIFTGEVANHPTEQKKFKPPTSAAYFASMSDIPEDLLTKWLERVVDRGYTPKQFMERCQLYKKTVRVQAWILNFINDIRPGHDFETFEEALQHYTILDDPDYLRELVSWCGATAKDKLHAHVKEDVKSKIIQFEQDQALENKV